MWALSGPIASKLAPTGFSFSTLPQPSRKSLWERACSRWRPQEPRINKKGEPTKVRPFCITPTKITAWPPTVFSFSTRPQPSRKSLWERACSRWRPPKHHTLPSIHKKGRTCEGSPFLHFTAWPATTLKLRIDVGRTGPIASKLAPTGFSFSTRPQPSRKSLWERACSRWRPSKHHTLPSIHKKGRTCEGSPFCVCPSAVTAWPATTPRASPDPARTDESPQPASRSPSHLRWTTSGTAPR